jgi:competence protein ComEA
MELLRPPPPTSWRGRVAALVSGISLGRVATGAGAVLLVAVTAWWLLHSPAPPVERSLPSARSPTATGAAPSTTPVQSPPTPVGSTAPSPPTTADVAVQAAGAVAAPGVYHVPSGARVVDVLAAAGGATADADVQAIPLAAKVTDGARVYVPRVGEVVTTTLSTLERGERAPPSPQAPLDLNQATLEQLDALPGVGPATAQAIVDYRTEHGPFMAVDDLLEVRGIGPAKLDGFRDLVIVSR